MKRNRDTCLVGSLQLCSCNVRLNRMSLCLKECAYTPFQLRCQVSLCPKHDLCTPPTFSRSAFL